MNRRRFAAMGSGFLGLMVVSRSWADSQSVSASSLIRHGDPIFGNPHGKVTIVDFYDIRCPPCRAMDPRFQRLLRNDHDVRYVPVDYPILGASSLRATEALFAAQQQGKYAQFRARLITQKRAPDNAVLKANAKALGLDWESMEFAMSGDATAHHVAANLARGRKLEIHEIPAIFINNRRIVGALSYDDLRLAVREALKPRGASSKRRT